MKPKRDKPNCSIPSCDRQHEARGYCRMHYRRWQKHGDPMAAVPRRTIHGEAREYFERVVLSYEGAECLRWPFGCSSTGYGQLWDGERFKIVSRLVCERVHGAAPTPEHQAAHLCGCGHLACVTKSHLAWKTPTENHADKLTHGTLLRGEACSASKLSAEQVREIRALKGRIRQLDIAVRFGIARSTVSFIHSGKNWGWLS